MRNETTSAAFFENKYRQNADPWDFEHSRYEQRRYAAILGSLRSRHYSRAFEPGCSIGILTQSLAPLCDHLAAIDISPTAVSRARERCDGVANITIRCGALPQAMPLEKFDLVIFSEIGYYFEKQQLKEIIDRLTESLNIGGILIASHWLGTSPDHLLSGDEVHRIIRESENLSLDEEKRYPGFRLDRMVRK